MNNLQRKRPESVRAKISAALQGQKKTIEHRSHISEGMKKAWMLANNNE